MKDRIIAKIVTALRQESTWRGIFTLLTACGIMIEPEMAEQILALGLTIVGTINIAKKD